MSENRAGGYREPLAGESLEEYEAAIAAAEDEVVAAIWRSALRGALVGEREAAIDGGAGPEPTPDVPVRLDTAPTPRIPDPAPADGDA